MVNLHQLTSFSGRTFTVIAADAIYARSAVEASRSGAIVDIDRAICARPAIHANTRKSSE